MKTNPLTIICCCALAATGAVVSANEHDASDHGSSLEAVYEDFASSGVFDLGLSNAKANELVRQGLFGSDPKLARLTLQAMAAHAMARHFGSGTVAERNFAAVPQLKEFLIASWPNRVAEEGHINILGDPDDSFSQLADAMDNDERDLIAATAAVGPDWLLIPRVLAASFPGDEDVHRFLWDNFAPHVHEPKHMLLMVFNEGRFKTPEVDRMRIESVGGDDHLLSSSAAEGLAFSRPEGGIDALVLALRNYPERAAFLVDALVSYGPEATPFLERIPEGDLPPPVFAQVRDGLERIKLTTAPIQQH